MRNVSLGPPVRSLLWLGLAWFGLGRFGLELIRLTPSEPSSKRALSGELYHVGPARLYRPPLLA